MGDQILFQQVMDELERRDLRDLETATWPGTTRRLRKAAPSLSCRRCGPGVW